MAVAATAPGSSFGSPTSTPRTGSTRCSSASRSSALRSSCRAAEAAQLDISAGLAIAVLAFIAVLPEYAVDFVLAFQGGQGFAEFGETCKAATDPGESPCSLALANMTGANRP